MNPKPNNMTQTKMMRTNLAWLLSAATLSLPAQAALFAVPIDNASFEDPDIGTTFGALTTGWAANGSTTLQDNASNSNFPQTIYGTQWGGAGNGAASGSIYQQVGTWDPNVEYLVSWLAGDRSNRLFLGMQVELWAGGTALGEGNDAFTLSGTELSALGAQLIESYDTPTDWSGSGVVTEEQSHVFNTGNAFTSGDALWLRVVGEGAPTGGPQQFFDNFAISEVPEPSVALLGGLGLLGLLRRRR